MNRPNRAARRAALHLQRQQEAAREGVFACQQRVGRATVLLEQVRTNYARAERDLEDAREALALALARQQEVAA